MSIQTNMKKIWQSGTVRQVVGATVGMLVAGGIYVGVEQVGNMNLAGMLVQPNAAISDHTNQVRINDKNVDDETLKRTEARAAQVTSQLQQYAALTQPAVSSAASTPLEQHTQDRLGQRVAQLTQFNAQAQHAAAPAPTYAANNGGADATQLERLAARAEQARAAREQAAADASAAASSSSPVSVSDTLAALRSAVKNNPALTPASSSEGTVVADAGDLHAGAPLQPSVTAPDTPKAKRLTSSGTRENLLILLALAGAAGMVLSDPARRMRLTALVAGK